MARSSVHLQLRGLTNARMAGVILISKHPAHTPWLTQEEAVMRQYAHSVSSALSLLSSSSQKQHLQQQQQAQQAATASELVEARRLLAHEKDLRAADKGHISELHSQLVQVQQLLLLARQEERDGDQRLDVVSSNMGLSDGSH